MKQKILQVLFEPTPADMTNIAIILIGLGLIMMGLSMLGVP